MLAPLRKGGAMDADSRTRAAIEEHWRASEGGNVEAEHAIYATDAILDYPQSGERFRGRATILAQRGGHPADRHFTVQRITGHANLWVSECIITYDGVPSYSVSIMKFADQHVVHETQYFADPFVAPTWVTSAGVVYRRPLGDLVLRLCGEFGGQDGVVG
ncbi:MULTISPECIES: nuclear transport factor 2 family protein, partial [Streptomyces]|uniref:nuclear transport factor 2 family protein n=1 Tax=Streptomyces TaxID=1883 RepID=UPI0018FE6953